MIVRLVKMTFRHDETETFERLFYERQEKISSFEGCVSVELLKENKSHENGVVYFTRSIWNSENDLNNYRKSEFFADTWKSTKALFAGKAEAWTLELASPEIH
ncbi:MAG: antibiotic biosynthesis monooxygenase [Bacteroidetes bacterium]|nr:antibiotic biosynthesis monooxygenase [Bacteroidota bacterium]